VEAAVDAASNPRTGEPRSGLRFARIRTVGLGVNEWLHKEGAAILAHGNTRKRLAAAQRVEDWGFNFPQSPPAAIPSEVFSRDKILKANGTTPALKHYGPAHTDGDISVALQEPDVLHTGDTYWNGFYPFIDYSTGGSIDGTIRAAEANLAAADDGAIVIPGHGPPVGNKAELKQYRDMLVAVREKVAAITRQGALAGRGDGAAAHRGVRRRVGPVRRGARLVHEARVRGRLIRAPAGAVRP
jgi:glyoxylase-like metal-dependent hydrolase (beta-lactamase superfamily II)